MKRKVIICTFCLLALTGFNHEEEEEIISTIKLMIVEINEKDIEGYINLLSDYFIRVTYGDKEYIRKNISKFGNVNLLEIKVIDIKSYYSVVHYELLYKDQKGSCSIFKGEIILEKTKNGWKIYSVTENIINKDGFKLRKKENKDDIPMFDWYSFLGFI